MQTQTRYIERLVDEQLKKWQAQHKEQKREKVKPGPVITITREPGSGGVEIARRLAKDLNMDLIGAQIIQKIAESADISTKVIESLDEKEVSRLDNWINSLFTTRHLWPDEYLFHLTKVVGIIGKQGNTIIVGRGAQYILPPEDIFRLRFIAPMEFKIQHMVEDHGSTREEAENYIIKADSDRHAFHRKYFNAEVADPLSYDMVINTSNLGIEGTIAAVKAAFTYWRKLRS